MGAIIGVPTRIRTTIRSFAQILLANKKGIIYFTS